MSIKFYDSELKVMDVLWKEGDRTAKQISQTLKNSIGWNVNTTYTVIKKCIAKGGIERTEPNFNCHALIGREEVQRFEANDLVEKMFDGATDKLFAALIGTKKLSHAEVERLKKLVDELEQDVDDEHY